MPVGSAHQRVLVKAFVWDVVIACGSEVIARHRRSYAREEMILDPLHDLALLEQKTNAPDQAAPLEGWVLPAEFDQLRRQMEARLGKRGRREYVQVLRLRVVMDTPQVLLEHYLKQLKLPTMLREYAKLAEQCARERVDFQRFLLRLVEAEMLDPERRAT